MDTKMEEKKTKLLGALDKGMVQVHLDARRPGVLVPAKFRDDFHLVLNLSYRFDPPDLAVSDWGVRQTLSFGGSRFTVGVPWSAIYAIASHMSRDFFMFPNDMPDEVMEGAVERQNAVPPLAPPEPGTARSPRAILREVVLARPSPGVPDAPEAADAPVPATDSSEAESEAHAEAEAEPAAAPAPPSLQAAPEPPPDPDAPREPSPPRRGHLRVVK